MNHHDAIAALRAAGVPEDAYGFDTVARDDAYMLHREAPDRWVMFYTERGVRHSIREFASEGAACRAFVAWILAAAWPTPGPGEQRRFNDAGLADSAHPTPPRLFEVGPSGTVEPILEEAPGHV